MDLLELEHELSRVRSALDSWSDCKQQSAQEVKDSHVQFLQDQHGKMQSMKMKQGQMESAALLVKQRLEREQREAESLQDASSSLRAEKDAMCKRLIALQESLHSLEQEQLQRETEAKREDNVKQKKVAALRKALSMYSGRLGLEFKQGADELLLEMTQVQASHPQRVFKVAVRVLPDNSYSVTQCDPPVEKLPQLVQQLNLSNSFGDFVKSLRQEFSKLANS
uniref:Kinetochore protein SPC25 n=1 Tax=Dunaliella tertiolecta TaxID=3047 RepID=A0A7S3VTS5_DUNTE|mmetsp:Transcript_18449/g.51757  ORF Transcript_18449/g.51757 Transcript_18449/m.51757 type:complete len:223 (-) Transcript_18449:168-836(-)|eukprot:CAMPEP_0202357690 /NCGR_PEP_ID=MMETSP1126-20121109/11623_1 /ASSEMBLY_ACC=CAM_ASM_000457 /TAXON_ID=3047 /ORGANISM="Dunaliella tertiolecta, Strain CCMP1320" /LENGTH=222 /DNA_ID=CAMNT_0048950635 /DNA_START=77 /DNA_END=745 /DNA_ORIENTATION=-